MQVDMNWEVQLGSYSLQLMEKVNIKKSVETLVDTATITLPATAYNKAMELEDKVKVGDKVVINLGYDGELVKEYEGYVNAIRTDGGALIIECEDELWNYRKRIADKVLKGADVKEILEYVNKEVGGGLSLVCDYSFTYDQFVIRGNTGYDVLKTIQDEAKPNIYLKGSVLHVHPQYSEIFGEVAYDFAENIDAEGTDLKYRRADERKLAVEVEGKKADGKVIKVEEGTKGGDLVSIKISGVSSEASLKQIAKETLARKVYDGYEGVIRGWMVPYCDAGYKAKVTDKEYEYKDGWYYVMGVEIDFAEASGGVRTVKLGKKVSD